LNTAVLISVAKIDNSAVVLPVSLLLDVVALGVIVTVYFPASTALFGISIST